MTTITNVTSIDLDDWLKRASPEQRKALYELARTSYCSAWQVGALLEPFADFRDIAQDVDAVVRVTSESHVERQRAGPDCAIRESIETSVNGRVCAALTASRRNWLSSRITQASAAHRQSGIQLRRTTGCSRRQVPRQSGLGRRPPSKRPHSHFRRDGCRRRRAVLPHRVQE
jgi:hypothetical protein